MAWWLKFQHPQLHPLEIKGSKCVVEHKTRRLLSKAATAVLRAKQADGVSSAASSGIHVVQSGDSNATAVEFHNP